jgi:dTDP-4-dehydrorhamnose reductase
MLVTGAAGATGSYVTTVFRGYETILTDLTGETEYLDVSDPDGVDEAVGATAPDVVLHLAAATDVDECEKCPDLAFRVNAIGTQNVALACQAYGATLVYVSTAGVFRGEKPTPYTEFDEPDPINVYGHSKLAGERIVASLLDRYYICRAGWMMGGRERDKKFVGKLASFIQQGSDTLQVVDDKVGSPTYALDLLAGIKRLLPTGWYGLYHMANEGIATRLEVARAMCDLIERVDISVQAVSSAYFPLPAPRPRSEALVNYKLRLLGVQPQRNWRDALAAYLGDELFLVSGGDDRIPPGTIEMSDELQAKARGEPAEPANPTR